MDQGKPLSKMTVSSPEAATLLMVSEDWVRKLHKMEYVPKSGRGKWALLPLVQGYIRFLKDEERRSSKSAAAVRAQDIRTERAAFELEMLKGKYAPKEELHLALDETVVLLKSSLLAVPAQFTRDVKERRRLEDLIAGALNRTANNIEKVVSEERASK